MTKIKILVVEDESIVAKDIQNSLKKLGYVVPTVFVIGKVVAIVPPNVPKLPV